MHMLQASTLYNLSGLFLIMPFVILGTVETAMREYLTRARARISC